MSRRSLAHAERQLEEITNQQGTRRWTRAVYVPQRTERQRVVSYVYCAAGEDPSNPKTKTQNCRSRRASRALREVKYMHGVKVYRFDGKTYTSV